MRKLISIRTFHILPDLDKTRYTTYALNDVLNLWVSWNMDACKAVFCLRVPWKSVNFESKERLANVCATRHRITTCSLVTLLNSEGSLTCHHIKQQLLPAVLLHYWTVKVPWSVITSNNNYYLQSCYIIEQWRFLDLSSQQTTITTCSLVTLLNSEGSLICHHIKQQQQQLLSTSRSLQTITQNRIRCVQHVARMGQTINVFTLRREKKLKGAPWGS